MSGRAKIVLLFALVLLVLFVFAVVRQSLPLMIGTGALTLVALVNFIAVMRRDRSSN